MMVMSTAITPSVKASRRPLLTRHYNPPSAIGNLPDGEEAMKPAALASIVVLLALQTSGQAAGPTQPNAKKIDIRSVSTRADRVSGGDVLIEVRPPRFQPGMQVTLNGHDVTSVFKLRPPRLGQPVISGSEAYTGLVTGLVAGSNTLRVSGKKWGVPGATLQLTNYPITGPIISGPHQQPFVCQTDTFKLPDGSTLGPATRS